MGLLNKLFGFRWSLYIVRDGKNIAYAMHEHSVMCLAGYVMGYFSGGSQPVAPWGLYLNFNQTHKTILLQPHHFTGDGGNVTPELVAAVAAIDPGWAVKSALPVFEEAATKKRLKISEHIHGDLDAMMLNLNKPRQVTFYSVMDEVFGKE